MATMCHKTVCAGNCTASASSGTVRGPACSAWRSALRTACCALSSAWAASTPAWCCLAQVLELLTALFGVSSGSCRHLQRRQLGGQRIHHRVVLVQRRSPASQWRGWGRRPRTGRSPCSWPASPLRAAHARRSARPFASRARLHTGTPPRMSPLPWQRSGFTRATNGSSATWPWLSSPATLAAAADARRRAFLNIHRPLGRAGQHHARHGRLHRAQLRVHLQQEAVLAGRDLEQVDQVGHWVGLHADGQHHQVGRHFDLFAARQPVLDRDQQACPRARAATVGGSSPA